MTFLKDKNEQPLTSNIKKDMNIKHHTKHVSPEL